MISAPAADVSFSVFKQLRHLGTVSLGLNAASLGGAGGNVRQLATGGAMSDLNSHAENAVQVAQYALTHISNIESILERAAVFASSSLSQLESISNSRDAQNAALATRSLFAKADIV